MQINQLTVKTHQKTPEEIPDQPIPDIPDKPIPEIPVESPSPIKEPPNR